MTAETRTFTASERRLALQRSWRRAPQAVVRATVGRFVPGRDAALERIARRPEPTSKSATLAAAVALEVSTWTYAWDDPRVRHLGPMAQDFASAFGLGSSDRRIDIVDYCGVLLTCVQALHDRVLTLEAQVAAGVGLEPREEVIS